MENKKLHSLDIDIVDNGFIVKTFTTDYQMKTKKIFTSVEEVLAFAKETLSKE